MDSIQLVI